MYRSDQNPAAIIERNIETARDLRSAYIAQAARDSFRGLPRLLAALVRGWHSVRPRAITFHRQQQPSRSF